MTITNILSRGRITIPAELRKKLGLKPGDQLSITSTDVSIIIEKKRRKSKTTTK